MAVDKGRTGRLQRRPRPVGRPGAVRPPAPRRSRVRRLWDGLEWFDRPRPRVQQAAVFTLGWAILGTIILAGVVAWSAWQTHGKPVEHLTAANVQKQLASDCDRFRHVQLHHWVVSWRSSDPPPGMPTDFVSIECHSWDVGETARLVRTSGDPRTEVRPPEEGPVSDYVEAFAVAGLVVLPFLFLGRLGWLALSERFGSRWSVRRLFRRT